MYKKPCRKQISATQNESLSHSMAVAVVEIYAKFSARVNVYQNKHV